MSGDFSTSDDKEQRLARLEQAVWALAWMLCAVCAAMLGAALLVWVRGGSLNADMDVINAARGG